MSGLIDFVQIGLLLAVDLDIDEEPVYHLRYLSILERLVGHDVTPVAGRIADGEQMDLSSARADVRPHRPRDTSPPEVGVLQQIEANLPGKAA